MEITGKLTDILEPQTGTSAKGEWKKQDFIIETEEQFPRKICISNWNDKVDINSIQKGTSITLSVNIESREFKGKWYTDIRAWKMQTAVSEAIGSSVDASPPPPPPPVETTDWENSTDVDDLPF